MNYNKEVKPIRILSSLGIVFSCCWIYILFSWTEILLGITLLGILTWSILTLLSTFGFDFEYNENYKKENEDK
jgi:hypothetical protein